MILRFLALPLAMRSRVRTLGGLASVSLLSVAVGGVGCGNKAKNSGTNKPSGDLPKVEIARPDNCPAEQPAPTLLPGATQAHLEADYWFAALGERHDLDKVLLSASAVSDLNASMRVPRRAFFPQQDLLVPLDLQAFQSKVQERFVWMQGKLESGEYKRDQGPDPFQKPENPAFAPTLRVALEETQIFCAPTSAGFFDSDATSTRINRNMCSDAHAQELVELVAPWTDEMLLVRTATSWGFIKADAALSPAIDSAQAAAFARGPYALVARAIVKEGVSLPAHSRLPLVDPKLHRVQLASATGVIGASLEEDEYQASIRPFTRRAVIAEALSYVGLPYGFGGLNGGIDCSRLMLDVMGAFGIELPRFSGWQARAGSFHIDVGGLPDDKKLEIIDKANESGVVMMELPGHIMLYLGRDKEGVPMAVHAIAYYLDSCPGGLSSKRVVGQVQVGGLELGRGTEKTALIERIERVTVLGERPVEQLEGLARSRPAAPVRKVSSSECRKLSSQRLTVSPHAPAPGEPVRVIATSRASLGPATISFFDAGGKRHDSLHTQTTGPPSGYIGELSAPAQGKWMAVWGDGEQTFGCTRFRVTKRSSRISSSSLEKQAAQEFAAAAEAAAEAAASAVAIETPEAASDDLPPLTGAPIWKSGREWSNADDDLFATFSERLFDYPLEDDLTWPNLYTLLRDPSHNILFNHFGRNEEQALTFVPDCADLPYTLRAYFAWKLGLPFGVHECKRARDNRPPTCDVSEGNLMSRLNFKPGDDIEVFKQFVNYHVRRMVHSSSGRTHPDDDETDFYPVPLNRKSLRPGTLFTDPYGHLLVVVKWVDQGATGYGALIGADAQPDGTVGRRRFWQGSFLFDPDTTGGGAGFKAFRPWRIDPETEALVTVPNTELRHDATARFSREQYTGAKSDFYDKMESIINPRPLDAHDKMVSLVVALEEQASRRVTSVQNGEDFMRTNDATPMVMPEGAKIFLTSGPWEDFATPSRDWRLLVAMHTVMDFPEALRRSPAQYGIDAAAIDQEVATLRSALDKELSARSFSYTRSDQSAFTLTLKDMVERRVDFEMSYNPNDCAEIRWAAPEGSDERKTCNRQAPAEQRQKMEALRAWFSERSRPAL